VRPAKRMRPWMSPTEYGERYTIDFTLAGVRRAMVRSAWIVRRVSVSPADQCYILLNRGV